jgi:hypothetical protein
MIATRSLSRQPWTPDEDAVVCARYPHEPTHAIAADLQRTCASVSQRAARFGLKKTDAYLASPAAGRLQPGDRRGASTRFMKGQAPANKGLRRPGWAPGRMRETQFKPGERRGTAAKNWRPVGTILTDADGYLRIKVREWTPGEPTGFGNVRVWPMLQRVLWEQAHGPIPPGHSVCFRDGNKQNVALDNLELVSRRELMRRNTVHNLPAPLPQTIQLLGALRRQIRRRTQQHGQEQNQ